VTDRRSDTLWWVLLPALVLLALGLLVDFGFAGARADEVRRLIAQRETLRAQVAGQEGRAQRAHELALRLDGDDLAAALAAQQAVDPVSYLGSAIRQAGLHSLELGTEASNQSAQVMRTRYYVRASGSYGGLLRFVRSLESDPRVLTIDSFTAERIVGETGLDIRVNLSFYEPLAGQ
jgi:hypothetical protein